MSSAITGRKVFEFNTLNRVLEFLAGDGMTRATRGFVNGLAVPMLAIAVFLGLWSVGAKNVQTSLGQLPGPAKVWEQAVALHQEHVAEREKADAFYQRTLTVPMRKA